MPHSALLQLRLRLRPDLVICPQRRSRGHLSWIVKDPIAMRYFTFCAEEFSILEALDGTMPLEELRKRFERLFPPQRMSIARLAQFLGNLYLNGLLLSDEPEQAATLLKNSAEQHRRNRWRAWTNPLAIRFSGINPQSLLNWLYPKLRWCLSPLAIVVYCLLMVTAAMLLAAKSHEFSAQLPTLGEFVSARNVVWLAVALVGIKILHELAHALVCKHFGGECHELGVLLLIFTPCLYCNVTDAWMLQDRWRRIAISAAGIGIEVVLASLAVFVWWFTSPGLINTVAVNMILVCGIGTVVFNGNPLLRYDGYFILSDLLDMPNLWQDSRATIHRRIGAYFTRVDEYALSDLNDRRWVLMSYGIASMLYQMFVVVAVILFLNRCLIAAGLDVLAYLLFASLWLSILAAWGPRLYASVANPWFHKRARQGRIAVALMFLLATLAAMVFFPLPCRLLVPALIQPEDAQRVYVTTPGTLAKAVTEGEVVKAGAILARLNDPEMNRKLIELAGEHKRLQARVKHLDARAAVDAQVASELVVAREICADAARRLIHQQREAEALALIAPIDGTVIGPPTVAQPRAEAPALLPQWAGTPLEPQNEGCFLARGTLFCTIGDPVQLEAVVFVDESDIHYVQAGQQVRLSLDVGSGATLRGEVVEIAQGDMQFVPPELAAERELASRPDAAGIQRPLDTAYQVRVRFTVRPTSVIIGARGRAKIEVEPQSLATRLYRAFRRVSTIEM